MAMYSALRDAFNDLNKSVSDQADWNERHAVDKERRATERMVLESNLQDQLLRRDQLKLASRKARDQMTPKVADPSKIMPNKRVYNSLSNNPDWIKDSETIMGGKWNGRGWTGENGQPIMLDDLGMARKMAAIDGLTKQYHNGPAQWTVEGLEIDEKISVLQQNTKKMTNAEKIQANKDLHLLKQRRNKLNSNLTDRNMLRYWSQMAQSQRGKAIFFASLNDPVTAGIMQKGAEAANTNIGVILKRIDGTKGTGTPKNEKVYNVSGVPQEYITRGGKKRTIRPGGWVDSFTHTPKLEGDIMAVARAKVNNYDDSWMGLDQPRQGVGGEASAENARFNQGKEIVQKSTLPQGMLIPHDDYMPPFRDAADKEYARLMQGKNAPKTAAGARTMGHKALANTVKLHEKVHSEYKALMNAKKIGGGTFTDRGPIQYVISAGKETVTISPEVYQVLLDEWNEESNLKLGYKADWEFTTRSERGRPRGK